MAKSVKPPVVVSVDAFIANLPSPFGELMEAVRKVFLSTSKEIGEIIKWNAPCFVYTGAMKPFNPKEYKRDIAVVNVRKGILLIVFPTGARVANGQGLLEGSYTDGRRLATILDMNDLRSKEKVLQKVLKEWLQLVEK